MLSERNVIELNREGKRGGEGEEEGKLQAGNEWYVVVKKREKREWGESRPAQPASGHDR